MSFRNVVITGGLSLAGIAVLMGVADREEGGLMPGSSKAPSGGTFLSAPSGRTPPAPGRATAPRAPAPGDDGVRRVRIRTAPDPAPDAAPDAATSSDPARPDLLDRALEGALGALRAARAAGDRVFGRRQAGAEVDAAPPPD